MKMKIIVASIVVLGILFFAYQSMNESSSESPATQASNNQANDYGDTYQQNTQQNNQQNNQQQNTFSTQRSSAPAAANSGESVPAASVIAIQEQVEAGTEIQRMRAMEQLLQTSPKAAADSLRELLLQSQTDRDVLPVISQGVLGLFAHSDLLTNNDLVQVYDTDEPALKKVAAITLAQRGDRVFLHQYIEERALDLSNENDYTRVITMKELGSLGAESIPYAINGLNDRNAQMRMESIAVIAQHGTSEHVNLLEGMLTDKDEAVRQQAQLALQKFQQ